MTDGFGGRNQLFKSQSLTHLGFSRLMMLMIPDIGVDLLNANRLFVFQLDF